MGEAFPATSAKANFPQFSNPHLPQFSLGKRLTIFLSLSVSLLSFAINYLPTTFLILD